MNINAPRLLLVVAILYSLPFAVQAEYSSSQGLEQLSIITTESTISISLKPENPQPNSKAVATLDAPSESLNTGEIAWMINGEVIISGKDKKSITFNTGNVGEKLELAAIIQQPGLPILVARKTINPSRVTLLKESETYTPPFYKGRSRHSAHAYIKFAAIAEIPKDDGSLYSTDELVYSWSKNSMALQEQSGVGKSIMRIKGPGFKGTDLITVRVSNAQNTISANMSTVVESEDPEILIYERKPLLGIKYFDAIKNGSTVPGPDVHLIAEPYFVDAESKNSKLLQYKWTIDTKEVQGQEKSSELLFTADGNIPKKGIRVSVALNHLQNFVQSVNTSIRIKINEVSDNFMF